MRFIKGEVLPEGKDLCDMSGAVDRPTSTPSSTRCCPGDTSRRCGKRVRTARRVHRPAAHPRQGHVHRLRSAPCEAPRVPGLHLRLASGPGVLAAAGEGPGDCHVLARHRRLRVANGSSRFLPGSNKESTLRKHAPVRISKGRMDEESSHALATTLSPADEAAVRTVEIKRGDITVHDQRVVHGSGPNNSEGWRRAYVLAFRTKEMVEEERRLGFSHSHNDEFNWDAFHAWQEKSDAGEAQPGITSGPEALAGSARLLRKALRFVLKDQPRVVLRTRGYTSTLVGHAPGVELMLL